jgi:hypothetical protein
MNNQGPIQDNLSILFCGPVESPTQDFPGTAAAAARLRELLPGAEFILTTWRGAELPERHEKVFDRVLWLADPGGMTLKKISGSEFVVNFRRLVCAALEAASVASRAWVWRIRCDCFVADARALGVYAHLSAEFRPNNFSIFQAPVLIPTIFTRDPRKGGRIGHPSDLMHLGRREDVMSLFQAAREGPFYRDAIGPAEGSELSPEQMIWQSALRKFRPTQAWSRVTFPASSSLLAHEHAMLGNFLLADFGELGASFKKDFLHRDSPGNCFASAEFRHLRRASVASPFIFGPSLLSKSLWSYIRNVARVRIVPLLFDWSADARRYKSGLLQACKRKLTSSRG